MSVEVVMCGFCGEETAGEYRLSAGGSVVCAERCEPGRCNGCGGQTGPEAVLCAPCRIEQHERALLPMEQWGWDGTPWDADDPSLSVGQR